MSSADLSRGPRVAEFEGIKQLFEKYPWRTASKFIPLAKRYGFSEEEAREFLKESAPRDARVPKPRFTPIFSTTGKSYQFDTLIQRRLKPFLVFINVNTRKAYAYQMMNKGSVEVLKALEKFVRDAGEVKVLTSDQDSAYLSDRVLSFLREHEIGYRTTEDNNHNVLGIGKRFIRTLRDLNGGEEFTELRMKELISEYNQSPHWSLKGKSPSEMTDEDEKEYIKRKEKESESAMVFEEGDRVRIVLDKKPLEKRRSNLSREAYLVIGVSGKQYIIKAADGSVDKYPAYRLVKCDSRYPLAKTIKQGKRGVVERIIRYNEKRDKYRVQYDEGTIDEIPAKNLREGSPLKLSFLERQFWARESGNGKKVPKAIRAIWISEQK